jgi:hypothetical protein
MVLEEISDSFVIICFFFFLAYVPKMKIGLWDDHAVCLSPHQPLSLLVDFHDIWQGGDAIQGDLDAIIFNAIESTV